MEGPVSGKHGSGKGEREGGKRVLPGTAAGSAVAGLSSGSSGGGTVGQWGGR